MLIFMVYFPLEKFFTEVDPSSNSGVLPSKVIKVYVVDTKGVFFLSTSVYSL